MIRGYRSFSSFFFKWPLSVPTLDFCSLKRIMPPEKRDLVIGETQASFQAGKPWISFFRFRGNKKRETWSSNLILFIMIQVLSRRDLLRVSVDLHLRNSVQATTRLCGTGSP